jgi:uncharacterized damage-inducible protein DinB
VIGYISRLLRYDVWANQQTLRSLSQQAAPPKSLRWLGHIVGAERLWIARLVGEPSSLSVWPDLTIEQCRFHLEELSRFWPEYMNGMRPERLSDDISYVNSKGEPWTSTIGDILTHITIHSGYHRGQIASDMRAAGQEPAYTDYIHAVRIGAIG